MLVGSSITSSSLIVRLSSERYSSLKCESCSRQCDPIPAPGIYTEKSELACKSISWLAWELQWACLTQANVKFRAARPFGCIFSTFWDDVNLSWSGKLRDFVDLSWQRYIRKARASLACINIHERGKTMLLRVRQFDLRHHMLGQQHTSRSEFISAVHISACQSRRMA